MVKRPDTALRNKSKKQRQALSESWKTEEVRAARSLGISKALQGNKNGRFRKGIKHTPEARERMRMAHLGKTPWNKGKGRPGRKEEVDRIRHSKEYAEWRTAVFQRDGYICVIGGIEHGSKLHADHIKPFSQFPELRFEVSNGRTLCISCHKQTATYGNKAVKYK